MFKIPQFFEVPVLNRERITSAFAIAVGADVLQVLLGPFGWTFADEFIDIIVMILTCRLIGFHALLLPTFVVEILPVIDMLPTWTGCVGIVVALRKRQQAQTETPAELPPGPVIDV